MAIGPGQPIVQFINNVFVGSGDDHLDLDGTDAWVEGNIFLHAHKNGSPDSSSAVSGGLSGAATSEVTIMGNIFYDCDQAAMAKEGNFFTLINNTVVRQTRVGGTDTDGAVICLADDGTTQGAGMYLEGNIIYAAENLVRNQTTALVTFTNNIMPLNWSGPGGGNSTIDPQLTYVPALGETYFTDWAQAQVMKQWFSLQAGSPAFRSGPNFQDKGGVIPVGVSISGEPSGTTPGTSATLRVGVARTGNGIPTAGWPNGSGYTHYKWRLDGGSWSAETPINTPITLTGLANGPHAVEVVGKNDALLYQDDLQHWVLDATIARSQTWVVQTNSVSVRLNEILARNDSAVPVGTKYPDLIELYNPGTTQVDLSGMSISDSKDNARKYVFPPGTYLPGGNYLVLYADNASTPPGYHLGFTLKQEADDVTLYAANGRLVDSVAYGQQITDLSIGRLADGSWGLTRPTFGAANQAVQLGGHQTLKINEWLARGITPITYDYVELFNPDPRPVSLAGLFLTDNHTGASFLSEIAPLSFIAGSGYTVFIADGKGGEADHLNFRLSSDRGMIALLDEEGCGD